MIKRPRGVYDLINDVEYYNYVTSTIRNICENYQVGEIRLPMFESIELFKRGTGETTDIVSKEIYTFNDKKDREFALRPEGTAGVMRSYIENKLYGDFSTTTKQFYIGEFFRYERPQSGRQRQFNQFGVEYINIKDNNAIIEIFLQISEILNSFGLNNLKFTINNLGTLEQREEYKKNLVLYLSDYKDQLCEDCLRRIDQNPLRILDCKIDSKKDFVSNSPKISQFYSDETQNEYSELKYILDNIGIKYDIDESMVRGLDYYSSIIFEVEANGIALLGGGCYNGLFEQLGGSKPVNSIGYAIGVERLINILKDNNYVIEKPKKKIYILDKVRDERSKLKLLNASKIFRQENIIVEYDLLSKSNKALFKYSDKVDALVISIDNSNIENENEFNVFENSNNTIFDIEQIIKKVKNV